MAPQVLDYTGRRILGVIRQVKKDPSPTSFLLLLLLTNVFFLLSLALGLELSLTLERVKLLFHFFSCFGLMCMEDHISPAEALLNLNQTQLETWAELVQSDCHLSVLLFVLVVLWQGHFGAG